MCLPLGTLKSIIRTDQSILVKLIDLVNSVVRFLSQVILFRWLTFLLGFLSVNLIVLLFWIYLFLLMLVFVLQWLSLHWEIWSCGCFSFHWLIVKKQVAPSHQITCDYSHADRDGLHDHLRDAVWEDIFKLSASAAANEFVSGFRLELMYISLIVNIRPSLTHLNGCQLLVLLP